MYNECARINIIHTHHHTVYIHIFIDNGAKKELILIIFTTTIYLLADDAAFLYTTTLDLRLREGTEATTGLPAR